MSKQQMKRINLNEDCYNEFPEWWNNEELLHFHDVYYGHKQGDLN